MIKIISLAYISFYVIQQDVFIGVEIELGPISFTERVEQYDPLIILENGVFSQILAEGVGIPLRSQLQEALIMNQ